MHKNEITSPAELVTGEADRFSSLAGRSRGFVRTALLAGALAVPACSDNGSGQQTSDITASGAGGSGGTGAEGGSGLEGGYGGEGGTDGGTGGEAGSGGEGAPKFPTAPRSFLVTQLQLRILRIL